LTQPSRDRGAEFQYPAPHRFTRDVEPSFGQEFLDVSITQREAEIQPDGVFDDLGREAVAAVAEGGHADILSDTPLAPDPVSVTMPLAMI
jgi:hypothetical protein